MKRVELRVHKRTSRVPFRTGELDARLYEVDADGIQTGKTLFTTRGHATWASAARAALKKADKMAWNVLHRGLMLRKIESEESGTPSGGGGRSIEGHGFVPQGSKSPGGRIVPGKGWVPNK